MRIARMIPLLLALFAVPARAQIDAGDAAPPSPSTLVSVATEPLAVHAGATATAVVRLTVKPTWHINANPPSPDYMIPTLVQVRPAFGLAAGRAVYPEPQRLKVEFDPEPLAVYSGAVQVQVPIAAAAAAVNGTHTLRGSVRYQSCNDKVCTAPTTVPFTLEIAVTGGREPGAEAAGSDSSETAIEPAAVDTARATLPTVGSGGALPPAAPVELKGNWVANTLARGGWVAILMLVGLGLSLNLTPCVYPMFGVTVSIFGARTAAHPVKVFGSALVYVLGMMVMYSTLGTIAGVTGKLFGSTLQNPLVSAGIGVVLIVMALSMFGLYELQPPPWLLQRLGGSGATNALGLFASGLVVGVFAAPCVGPPIVALLAIVAAKADVWFGFRTFFILSVGLGAPYLLLATSSNLLQKLPRSGDWMVWVKQVFGVAMVSFGLFYVLTGLAPRLTVWVMPAALLLGGLYLGFIERSGMKRPGFLVIKRVAGLASVAFGVWLVVSARKPGLEFQPYDPRAVETALAAGKPVMLDFSADWCIPCRKLEYTTFTDRRVIAATRDVALFRVDMTRSGSPEVEALTHYFRIAGVPTILFLRRGGEVGAARFSEPIPADQFLEKLKLATAAS